MKKKKFAYCKYFAGKILSLMENLKKYIFKFEFVSLFMFFLFIMKFT